MTPIALSSFLKWDLRGSMKGAVKPMEMYESIKRECILLLEETGDLCMLYLKFEEAILEASIVLKRVWLLYREKRCSTSLEDWRWFIYVHVPYSLCHFKRLWIPKKKIVRSKFGCWVLSGTVSSGSWDKLIEIRVQKGFYSLSRLSSTITGQHGYTDITI